MYDNNNAMCMIQMRMKKATILHASHDTPSATSIVAAVLYNVHVWEFEYQRWQISRLPLDYDVENYMLSSLLRQHIAFRVIERITLERD